LPSLKLQNFKSDEMKPKFCTHLLKILKVKLKFNKVLCNFIPLKFLEISLVSLDIINFCKTSQILAKLGKSQKIFMKNVVKMSWKNSQISAQFH